MSYDSTAGGTINRLSFPYARGLAPPSQSPSRASPLANSGSSIGSGANLSPSRVGTDCMRPPSVRGGTCGVGHPVVVVATQVAGEVRWKSELRPTVAQLNISPSTWTV
jgi:hypothetical protein